MSKCSPQLQEALVKQFQNISAGARLHSIMLLVFFFVCTIYTVYVYSFYVYTCLHMDFLNMIRYFPFITIFEIYWDVWWLVFFFYGFWMSESQYIRDDHLNFHQPSTGHFHLLNCV